MSAVYTKALGMATGYLIFYTQKGTFGVKLWSAYVVIDNARKSQYVISVNQLDPSSINPNWNDNKSYLYLYFDLYNEIN